MPASSPGCSWRGSGPRGGPTELATTGGAQSLRMERVAVSTSGVPHRARPGFIIPFRRMVVQHRNPCWVLQTRKASPGFPPRGAGRAPAAVLLGVGVLCQPAFPGAQVHYTTGGVGSPWGTEFAACFLVVSARGLIGRLGRLPSGVEEPHLGAPSGARAFRSEWGHLKCTFSLLFFFQGRRLGTRGARRHNPSSAR